MFVLMKFVKTLLLFFLTLQLVAQNQEPKNFTIADGFPSNNITEITQNNIGEIWFISGDILTRFNGKEFNKIGHKNELTNVLATKNDSILIGSETELVLKTGNNFKTFESKKILSILVAEGTVFAGTTKGITILKKDNLNPIKTNFQIDLNPINDLKFDGKNYWIATNKALWKANSLLNPTSLERIEQGDFKSLLVTKNDMIAHNDIGIFTVEGNQAFLQTQEPKQITDIQEIDNQFWIATKDNGITVLNQDFSFDRNINKYNTLGTNRINKIFQDNQKNIWIATANKGLYKFPSEEKSVTKPTLSFENIEVVYQALDSINVNHYNKVLQLPADKKHISFSFKTVNINQPKNVLYRYKLTEEFSPWTAKNTVDFANLQAGNYTFTAQSKIDNNESKPIQFQFFIDKPFYEKAWFQWSALALIALILGGSILNYILRIKRKNKVKLEKLKLENHLLSLEQKALQLQMNPHFIFNVLNGIKALGSSGKSTELNSTVSKFATLLRSVLHNSRQDEISLAEEIITLKNYLDLEQQMSANSFEYSIKTDVQIDTEEILIPPMLLQPFVENAIKHGVANKENGKITVSFVSKNNFLHCTVEDNGIGFEQSKKGKQQTHQSVAVKVTQERIESVSADSKFTIRELKENNQILGTRVWFKIPLKTDY